MFLVICCLTFICKFFDIFLKLFCKILNLVEIIKWKRFYIDKFKVKIFKVFKSLKGDNYKK